MNQHDFYETPEVRRAIEIQKHNAYGSDEHKNAYACIMKAAIKYGVQDEYMKSGGGEY